MDGTLENFKFLNVQHFITKIKELLSTPEKISIQFDQSKF
jgi:hypothetical protein